MFLRKCLKESVFFRCLAVACKRKGDRCKDLGNSLLSLRNPASFSCSVSHPIVETPPLSSWEERQSLRWTIFEFLDCSFSVFKLRVIWGKALMLFLLICKHLRFPKAISSLSTGL